MACSRPNRMIPARVGTGFPPYSARTPSPRNFASVERSPTASSHRLIACRSRSPRVSPGIGSWSHAPIRRARSSSATFSGLAGSELLPIRTNVPFSLPRSLMKNGPAA